MFGEIVKGPCYTRFRIQYELTNGVPIFEVVTIPNEDIERYPAMYGWTLTRLVEKLEKRIAERAQ